MTIDDHIVIYDGLWNIKEELGKEEDKVGYTGVYSKTSGAMNVSEFKKTYYRIKGVKYHGKDLYVRKDFLCKKYRRYKNV